MTFTIHLAWWVWPFMAGVATGILACIAFLVFATRNIGFV